MININHPAVHGKPPIKKYSSTKEPAEAKQPESRMEKLFGCKEQTSKIPVAEKADYNENIIDSTGCSFEQLCSMINDLEENIANEIPDAQLQMIPERDIPNESGTTYYDIMSFLEKLEDGTVEDGETNVPEEAKGAVFEEILKGPLVFEEDLVTAQLQIEEKNASIELLREQLKSERQIACEKLEAARKRGAAKVQAQEDKCKGIVKRHQKFIEQLISEKAELTEKCGSLAHRVKEIEVKMQRDMKAAADRHVVELQRAKEHYAAAEKIKRERWIEARTTKIKEMTVKGLEPELRNMMEQHAEEIQRLRNTHMKELQDAELRVIRRSNEQLEQLRLELTASHERMLANEKNILWSRYKEKLEEQEHLLKVQHGKLVEELQGDREEFKRELAKRDAERDRTIQLVHLQHQQEMETLKQRQASEQKTVQDSLKTEWEAWLTDYKRQQNLRFEKSESKIRDECNRERDRQIEIVIERLEKDSREANLRLQQTFDCKLSSLKDKYEMNLQTAVDNEQIQKSKLLQMREKLERSEGKLGKVEFKLQENVSELSNANELINRLTAERDNARKLARQDIEVEKRGLEEKIASLYQEMSQNNNNRDASIAQLHSRIKLIITQKVLTIKNLRKELNDVRTKCQHLEKLLDQQRREYILKSF